MNPREAAENKVRMRFAALKAAKQKAHEEFIQALREAHDVGISDKEISDLIDNEYKRSSICQFRNKESA